MRILAVHLRNLNSLAGSWSIDFTGPDYAAAGIFAITGPTGAGKSTILDAICLALFARTPRLGHISKTSNEIMSRRAGDCFAEVDFETRQGRYRCHWGQHRARRSPDGDLQPPRHEIVDSRTGKVLETRSKEVSRLVEQVTGMDYDRFTRSMLLAQGDFAAFLDADGDQRAPILEQITGTSIYSQISIAVHERVSEERRKTASLKEAMGHVILLGAEEEQTLAAHINANTTAAAQHQQQLTAVGEALHRLATIASLQQQIRATEQLQLDWVRRFESAGEDLGRHERGLRAQALLGDYTRWQHLRERIITLRVSGESLRASIEGLQAEAMTATETHSRTSLHLQETLVQQDRENEVLKAARALDLRLHANRKEVEQVTTRLLELKVECEQHLRQRAVLDKQLAGVTQQQEQVETFCRDHGSDVLLVEQLAGLRRQLLQLREMDQELTRLDKAREERGAARTEAEHNRSRLQQAADTAGQELLTLQQHQETMLAEMQVLLAGQNPASLRQEIAQEEQRVRDLTWMGELFAQQATLEQEQLATGRSLQGLEARQRQVHQVLQTLEEKREIQQQLVAQLEHNQLLLRRICSYEEERHHLIAGEPCPLCGATSHPWAEQLPIVGESEGALSAAQANLEQITMAIAESRETLVGLAKDIEYTVAGRDKQRQELAGLEIQLRPLLGLLGDAAVADRHQAARLLEEGRGQRETARQRIDAVEKLESQVREGRQQREQAMVRHTELLRQVQAARHASETLAQEIRHLEEQRRAQVGQLDRCRVDLDQQLQPLGISECPPHRAERLLAELETRLQAWKVQQLKKEQLARDQATLQGEREREVLLLATMDQALIRKTAELEASRQEGARLREERIQLYGTRNPDVEEQQWKIRVQQAEAQERAARHRRTEIEKQLHGLVEQQRVSGKELTALAEQDRQQEAEFLGQLPAAGFVDLAAFSNALLLPEQLAELGTLKDHLDYERTVLTTRMAEQTAALEREVEKNRGSGRPKTAAELSEEQHTLSRELEALQQRIGADRERLAGNTLRKQEFASQQRGLEAQQREEERWALLHQLIGSADGKKFRVFAQGLTFDLMISHANRQLRKMNDRYILLRDPREALALQVLDNYQAGEIRSTRNLSGGESFLVSLALALGLSAMASHNVRVDSLFLDEGFGTLDEEALDTALQTLAELRQDGKLIGIISHVPLLKDRIDVRIQVLPGAGGCSRLVGPGCRQSA